MKSRPCLVIGTSQSGEPLVTIAYGTSAGSQSNRGFDLKLCDPED